ncbi:MAG: sigma-70 family RNA polymerase sigma factor [Candidatus Paceibacterota bacterium]|jgi:RNA polymerase sigma-70 factor (ECF subfamily)|nr:sigma-70 family RNA polymerase sigma factor [Candidatus Paceibacterota bacterium]
MERDDSQLIRDHLGGDERSFEVLMKRHIKAVYNFVYRLVPTNVDTDEIVSETFFKVWKNLKKFRAEENFTAWIFTIARNTAYDKLRKHRESVFSDFDTESGENFLSDTLADSEPLPPELFEKEENKKIIQELLERIPTAYREVLLLRYANEFTFDDIAKILGKPLDTVKSQHRRALILLRKMLASFGG